MQRGNSKPTLKKYLSSDCTLQLEYMKLELLVIADQRAAVNTFPGLVHTARHTMEVGYTLRQSVKPLTTVRSATGVKS